MNHPVIMYELAKLRIAQDLRDAERQRLVREAGSTRTSGAIDAVRFRDRLARLFDAMRPSPTDGAAQAGA